jgi:hypothetical protein
MRYFSFVFFKVLITIFLNFSSVIDFTDRTMTAILDGDGRPIRLSDMNKMSNAPFLAGLNPSDEIVA